jgi:superfamily II DNA or RNA helicase
MNPRGWQVDALVKFKSSSSQAYLLDATPGSGKTVFSALCAKYLLDSTLVNFCLVVVPTTALKGTEESGFLADWNKCGVQLTTVLRDGRGSPKDFHGGIVTYAQLQNFATTLETWRSNGIRTLVVFDEVHHASEENGWGVAAEAAGRCSEKILAMTGTPFRGDGKRISWLRYGHDGLVIPDYRYGYRDAVRDKVCRPVTFSTDDGIAEYVFQETDNKVTISESTSENAAKVASVIFSKESDWLRTVISNADDKLDEYRMVDSQAGGIIICRAGTDESDDRHMHNVARMVSSVVGEYPEVITHDDPEANTKIDRFRRGNSKWICSVRKVSEGVDIPRLRVCVIANRPTTELLFRQIVGRVVRWTRKDKLEDATVFIAKFPQLAEWAGRISEEAKQGLLEQSDARSGRDRKEAEGFDFSIISSLHESGGAISEFGAVYAADEISAAEQLKRGDPELIDVPVVKLAYALRKAGLKPTPQTVAAPPLHVEKARLRKTINRLARNVAIKRDPDKPDFKVVWMALHRRIGARSIDDLMDNYTIDVMRQAEQLLGSWVAGVNEAA